MSTEHFYGFDKLSGIRSGTQDKIRLKFFVRM